MESSTEITLRPLRLGEILDLSASTGGFSGL